MSRVLALLSKELLDLRANPGVFLPAVLTGLLALLLPFFLAIVLPAFTGERLSESADFELALEMYAVEPAAVGLSPEGGVQAWIFRQFLVLLVFSPVAGAMSVAAYTVIGEKQARTLEPLLATPITTAELLGAKVLGAFIPALALTSAGFGMYLGGVWLFAEPGVYRVILSVHALSVVFLFGPLAALTALQLAVCVSSRVNDARSAQQVGALVILPLSGILVAQLMGSVSVTTGVVLVAAGVLCGANVILMRIGVAMFQRESILTRWK